MGWLPIYGRTRSPPLTSLPQLAMSHGMMGRWCGLGAWSNVHPTVYCLVVWNIFYFSIYWDLLIMLLLPATYNFPTAYIYIYIYIWLVVWNILWLSIYWECHHPNWRTPSFFRGVGQPPDLFFFPDMSGSTLAGVVPNGWRTIIMVIGMQWNIVM